MITLGTLFGSVLADSHDPLPALAHQHRTAVQTRLVAIDAELARLQDERRRLTAILVAIEHATDPQPSSHHKDDSIATRILEHLADGRAKSPKELSRLMGETRSIGEPLHRLQREGAIIRLGHGLYQIAAVRTETT